MNVFEAKKELNDFLREHPELQPMQDEINKLLKGAGSQHNRNVLLYRLMADNIFKLEKLTWEVLRSINKS